MIIFQHVTKQFPLGNKGLDDVSFTIEDNQFVFLVGPSGAGKTSILKLLLYQTRPTSGSIIVNGMEITSPRFRKPEVLRRNVGVVFQDFKVLHDYSVYENVSIALDILGESRKNITSQVKEALALVGLEDKVDMFPIQLSAGELQRVAIARAFVGGRDIILADEPTGNLDPKTTWEIMKVFKKVEKKKTILFATHNTEIVNSMKRRVLVMQKGTLVKDLPRGGYEL